MAPRERPRTPCRPAHADGHKPPQSRGRAASRLASCHPERRSRRRLPDRGKRLRLAGPDRPSRRRRDDLSGDGADRRGPPRRARDGRAGPGTCDRRDRRSAGVAGDPAECGGARRLDAVAAISTGWLARRGPGAAGPARGGTGPGVRRNAGRRRAGVVGPEGGTRRLSRILAGPGSTIAGPGRRRATSRATGSDSDEAQPEGFHGPVPKRTAPRRSARSGGPVVVRGAIPSGIAGRHPRPSLGRRGAGLVPGDGVGPLARIG